MRASTRTKPIRSRRPLAEPEASMTWRERLATGLTETDAALAGQWDTCKVGEEMEKYPKLIRMEDGEDGRYPSDERLRYLGVELHEAILAVLSGEEPDYTPEYLLDAIEERVIELRQNL